MLEVLANLGESEREKRGAWFGFSPRFFFSWVLGSISTEYLSTKVVRYICVRRAVFGAGSIFDKRRNAVKAAHTFPVDYIQAA